MTEALLKILYLKTPSFLLPNLLLIPMFSIILSILKNKDAIFLLLPYPINYQGGFSQYKYIFSVAPVIQ